MTMYGGLDLSDPVIDAIIKARIKLLLEQPFFGNIAMRLVLVDASKWCETAAVDGRRLYYNREFIKKLSQPKLLFLIGHEVAHCALDHLGRRGGREPRIWNMANDYIANDMLVKAGVGTMPDGGLLDKRFTDEMASEQVYELLVKNSVTIKMTLDMHLDDASEGDDEGDGRGDDEGDGQEVDVTILGKDGPPKITAKDRKQIRNEIRAAVIQAAQTCSAGKVPAGIRRLIDHLTQPKMDWRALLDAHIRSSVKDDYTFQRPSRRSWSLDAILPGQDYQLKIKIAVSIDASGSMSEDMLRDILSEVKGIMETFADFELDLWTFDTQVYSHMQFTPMNLDDIMTYPLKGGGGTMFECVFEYMKEKDIQPERLVFFTDGYPNGTWGEAYSNYVDTLFVIHGNNTIVAPWGLTAYYEEKATKRAA